MSTMYCFVMSELLKKFMNFDVDQQVPCSDKAEAGGENLQNDTNGAQCVPVEGDFSTEVHSQFIVDQLQTLLLFSVQQPHASSYFDSLSPGYC